MKASTAKGQAAEFYKYTYSANGLMLTAQNENMTETYSYDNLGRLTTLSDTTGARRTYTYDNNGNRTGFRLFIDNEQKLSQAYTYDALSRLTKVTKDGTQIAAYTYNNNGNRLSTTLGNGIVTSYSYNKAGLLTSLTNKKGSNTLSSYAYTYYLNGNQSTKTENTGKVTTYGYDTLGRLTSENEAQGSNNILREYTYDLSSNRSGLTVNKNGVTESTAYTYDDNNRLLKELYTNSGSGERKTTSYTYDQNGNNVYKWSSAVMPMTPDAQFSLYAYLMGDANAENLPELTSQHNTYDAFNRLSKAEGYGLAAEYSYDVHNMRISKTVNGDTTNHIWDGYSIVAETDGNGLVKDIYARGKGLISSTSNGYYLYNGHGDVIGLSNVTGAVTRSYEFDAFGAENLPDANDANPFRYSGEYYDSETGYIYLRNRYYDPGLGAFINEDPIRAGLNWYGYANANPVMFIDPMGLAAFDASKLQASFDRQAQQQGLIGPGETLVNHPTWKGSSGNGSSGGNNYMDPNPAPKGHSSIAQGVAFSAGNNSFSFNFGDVFNNASGTSSGINSNYAIASFIITALINGYDGPADIYYTPDGGYVTSKEEYDIIIAGWYSMILSGLMDEIYKEIDRIKDYSESKTQYDRHYLIAAGLDTTNISNWTVQVKIDGVHTDYCVEDLVVTQLMTDGAELNNIMMTPAFFVKNMQIKEPCDKCAMFYGDLIIGYK